MLNVNTEEQLDLFSEPKAQLAIQRSGLLRITPTNNYKNSNVAIFDVSPGDWLDLSQCYLKLKVHLENDDGTSMGSFTNSQGQAVVQKASLVNQPVTSMFYSAKIYLANNLAESIDYFNYVNFFSSLLNHSSDAKSCELELAGYFEHDANARNSNGKAFVNVKSRLENGGVFLSRLNTGMFNCKRLIPPGAGCRIELTRVPDDWALINITHEKKVKVVIDDLCLYVRKVQLDDALTSKLLKTLQSREMVYPHRKLTMRTLFIPAGMRQIEGQIWNGQCPNRAIVAFCRPGQLTGADEENPFAFSESNVQSISMSANDQKYNAITLGDEKLDFTNGDYAVPFLSLLRTMGGDTGFPGLSYKSFNENNTLFCFNLCTNENPNELQPHRKTPVSLEVQFSGDTPSSGLYAIVIGEFESTLYMDKHFNLSE